MILDPERSFLSYLYTYNVIKSFLNCVVSGEHKTQFGTLNCDRTLLRYTRC